jgi:hypothetical protein
MQFSEGSTFIIGLSFPLGDLDLTLLRFLFIVKTFKALEFYCLLVLGWWLYLLPLADCKK